MLLKHIYHHYSTEHFHRIVDRTHFHIEFGNMCLSVRSRLRTSCSTCLQRDNMSYLAIDNEICRLLLLLFLHMSFGRIRQSAICVFVVRFYYTLGL